MRATDTDSPSAAVSTRLIGEPIERLAGQLRQRVVEIVDDRVDLRVGEHNRRRDEAGRVDVW